jgi:hypothetical protein
MGDVGVIITATKMQLSVRSSKAERVNAVKRALRSRDVRNALTFIRSKGWSIDETKAEAALHKLKDGEMLAVGFPVSDKAVLVYYEYSGNSKIKSEAKLYVLQDGRNVALEFISVNGSLPIVTTDDCGPGLVECRQCVDLDALCAVACCSGCAWACPGLSCLLCVLITCGVLCIEYCCNEWDIYCCPTP